MVALSGAVPSDGRPSGLVVSACQAGGAGLRGDARFFAAARIQTEMRRAKRIDSGTGCLYCTLTLGEIL